METKRQIRKQILSLRNQQGKEEQMEKSRCIAQNLLSLSVCRDARTVFLYAGYGSEVLTEDLCQMLMEEKKQIAMPRVLSADGIMHFYEISDYSELKEGFQGILEPAGRMKATYTPDLLVMPGVAFDRDRNRLGYGRGFYDRFLAQLPPVRTAALAFDCQIVPSVPFDANDYRPELIITESEFI